MTENQPVSAPSFWTVEFHFQFFPRQLWTNLKHPPDAGKKHILFEIPITLALCGVLTAFGVTCLRNDLRMAGIILLGLSAAGLIALAVYCFRSTAGIPLRYSEFEPWIFIFLVFLGAFSGFLTLVFFLEHSPRTGGWGALGGLGMGYFLGILAGLGIQRLGPLRIFLSYASRLGLFVLGVWTIAYFMITSR